MSVRALSIYNPAAQDPETLRRNFVAREEVLADLVDAIRRETLESVAHHWLLLGQRGFGKTTLLHRLALSVREDSALSEVWIPLLFPEEQYNIASLAEFWRNCLDALSDAVELTNAPHAAELDAAQAGLDNRNAQRALDALLDGGKRIGRRLLLLIDNIDFVFERISEAEAWALRAELQRPGGPMVIAAAIQPLEASFNYEQAFYEFLQVRQLDALEFVEVQRMVVALAERNKRPDIAAEARDNPARLQALQLFTGGNPRTVSMLFRVLAQGLDGDVERDIENLLDQCTPLYKARIESLPLQQQRVFVQVALAYDPQTAAQVENRVGLGINATSSQLSKMLRAGLLRRGPMQGKRQSFEVAERFFNIWYLMRISRRERTKLLWLAKFMRSFYVDDSASLIATAKRLLDSNRSTAVQHAVREMLVGVEVPIELRERLFDHEILAQYLKQIHVALDEGEPESLVALKIELERQLENGSTHWMTRFLLALVFVKLREPKPAIEIAERLLEQSPNFVAAWGISAIAYFLDGQWSKAEAAARRLLEYRHDPSIEMLLIAALFSGGALDEGYLLLEKRLHDGTVAGYVARRAARTLVNAARFGEARQVYGVLVDRVEDPGDFLDYAQLLLNQGEFKNAEALARRALDRWPDHPVRIVLSVALMNQSRFQECLSEISRFCEIEPANPGALWLRAMSANLAEEPAIAFESIARGLKIDMQRSDLLQLAAYVWKKGPFAKRDAASAIETILKSAMAQAMPNDFVQGTLIALRRPQRIVASLYLTMETAGFAKALSERYPAAELAFAMVATENLERFAAAASEIRAATLQILDRHARKVAQKIRIHLAAHID